MYIVLCAAKKAPTCTMSRVRYVYWHLQYPYATKGLLHDSTFLTLTHHQAVSSTCRSPVTCLWFSTVMIMVIETTTRQVEWLCRISCFYFEGSMFRKLFSSKDDSMVNSVGFCESLDGLWRIVPVSNISVWHRPIYICIFHD